MKLHEQAWAETMIEALSDCAADKAQVRPDTIDAMQSILCAFAFDAGMQVVTAERNERERCARICVPEGWVGRALAEMIREGP